MAKTRVNVRIRGQKAKRAKEKIFPMVWTRAWKRATKESAEKLAEKVRENAAEVEQSASPKLGEDTSKQRDTHDWEKLSDSIEVAHLGRGDYGVVSTARYSRAVEYGAEHPGVSRRMLIPFVKEGELKFRWAPFEGHHIPEQKFFRPAVHEMEQDWFRNVMNESRAKIAGLLG